MKLLLLFLGLGLTLVCVGTEGTSSEENFDPEKFEGKWYTIALATNKRDKIEDGGSMRVFVESTHVYKNDSLEFKFHTKEDGECTELHVVCDKIGKNKYYTYYDGRNEFSILETDYDNYIVYHLINLNNGDTFEMLELYGRNEDLPPEIKEKFVDICQEYGIDEDHIIDLTKEDRCLQARDGGNA